MAAIMSGKSFGAEVCEALGLEKVKSLTIHIPLDGPVEVEAKIWGTEGLRKVNWAQLKDNVKLCDRSWMTILWSKLCGERR